MSLTGHFPHRLLHGDVLVEEYAYRVGPPTGILVLRYPSAERATHFPEARDDHRHQLFWSPDGVLAVRRGGATTHLGPDQAFWAARGTTLEVTTWGPQPVVVACVREMPPQLVGVGAASVELSDSARAALTGLCRPGLPDDHAMDLKSVLLRGLTGPTRLESVGRGTGPAKQVAAAMLSDPADPTELTEWARRLHISLKTLQRDFVREYAMSWTHWRVRMRLQASTALLGRHSVTDVAHRVGWASPSAYVQAFRKEYGVTPGAWARES